MIFFKELDIGNLAYSYGLVVMPRMPEIKSFAESVKSFEPVRDINVKEISFRYVLYVIKSYSYV